MTHAEKLSHSNAILSAFEPAITLEFDRGYWFCWTYRNMPVRKKWAARKGSPYYPVWYSQRPCGGTGCQAMGALVQWLRGGNLNRPWWAYVTGPEVGFDPHTLAMVDAAIEAESVGAA